MISFDRSEGFPGLEEDLKRTYYSQWRKGKRGPLLAQWLASAMQEDHDEETGYTYYYY